MAEPVERARVHITISTVVIRALVTELPWAYEEFATDLIFLISPVTFSPWFCRIGHFSERLHGLEHLWQEDLTLFYVIVDKHYSNLLVSLFTKISLNRFNNPDSELTVDPYGMLQDYVRSVPFLIFLPLETWSGLRPAHLIS